jgi:hypothetical protein
MKSRTLKTLLFALLISSFAFSQSKVKEKDVIGEWKFHLNFDKEIEEANDGDGIEKTFVAGILKTVDKLVEKVDIKFHFKKNHILTVTQKSSIGRSTETIENYKWEIDKRGKLITSDIDSDHLKFNDHNGWMIRDGKLVSVDENKEVEENVYMERVR